jgi:DNA-binding transcriptional MerR regulator
MAIEIDGKTFYRTADVCRMVGISRSTLMRWLGKGILEKSYRDRKGWRAFTEENLRCIRAEANRLQLGDRP